MAISDEISANILRYHHVEKWRIGTIARQLKVHHTTVKRVLSEAGVPKAVLTKKESLIAPFLAFILETLNKYPALTASRIYAMVGERGYSGSPDHFRHLISLYRPRPHAEAYLRLRTLPGEQAQVDWGHFGYIEIGKARRPLMAFVMVLSYSRKIFLQFYLDQRMANFLRGHEAAFAYFNGTARVLLYDNLKSAVLERRADAIRFNPELLAFAAHYRFEPRPVAVARGNEKGRVERAIRYIRDAFFAARVWKDVDDLNGQALDWCNTLASNRPCPEDKARTVNDVFVEEQPKLLGLPDNPYTTLEREEVNVGKTPYVRFDLNDYSVPYQFVRRVLTVCATPTQVSILDGINTLAEHPRSYDKGQQIEIATHIQELVTAKKEASLNRGQDRLIVSVPSVQTLLIQAAERGYALGSITATLLNLLTRYGSSELEIAVCYALKQDSPHPNAVRIHLETRREQNNQPPPIHMELPDDNRVRNLVIRPHDLNTYDALQTLTEEPNHEHDKK